MRRTKQSLLAAAVIALLALPLAAAQNNSGDMDLRETPTDVDVNLDGNDAPAEESTAGGLSTTVVIMLVVLAVLVVALIVAMANRP